jgi:glycosyltransferase involved in cell wall biosynthesis
VTPSHDALLTGRDFIVFSDDWGRHPSSCQHLFRRLAPVNHVQWVNTIGTRMPTLSRGDLARAGEKLREWTRRGAEPSAAHDVPVEVLRPFMTPFDRWGPFRKLNAKLLTSAIRAARVARTDRAPILVTTIPNAAGVVGEIDESASIYYCVDEFSEWPGADRKTMIALEDELLAKVDLVVATSEALFEAKSQKHARVRLLRHGVDWERFRDGVGTVPPELAALPEPRIGFPGLIDGRIDVDLVAEMATVLPDAQFVFIGPRQLPVGPLDALPNVRFLPAVPYDDMAAVLHAFDVGFLPYLENRLTERINPLKIREMMASGIPVVATPIPEVRRMGGLVRAPHDRAEWGDALRAALREGRSRAAQRSESVREDGWDARAHEFSRYCREAESTAREARAPS